MQAELTGTALLEWLTGDWSVERDINDGAGAFTGRAEFTPRPDGALCWHESGELTMDGGPLLPVTRTLTIDAEGEVRFDDGRSFHRLVLADGAADAFHPCGPDDYSGHYAIDGDDRFTVTWQVAGPGRDDTIRSHYTRLARGPQI